jgi:putative membrane protein
MVILPRQARYKQWENSNKETVFSQVAFVGTPLPWRQAVKVVISLYCLVCPFAFVQIAKYATPAVSFIFALLIFAIEEVAVEIEDPFGRTYPVQ